MATQRDVAKRSQVSVATVSRYINKVGYISPEIKKKIQKAIDELNYRPNLVARSLKLSSSKTFGFIFPDIENQFFIKLIKKAEETAINYGYNVILCNTENDTEKGKMYVEVLKGKLVDGYLIIPSTSEDPASFDILKSERVIYVDRFSGLENEVCIKLDNIIGVKMALEYLIRLGHQRIGVINVPLDITTGLERFQGYKLTLAKHQIPLERKLIKYADYSIESGYERTKELLALADRPSALFPMSGPTTIGALKAIKEKGLMIPDDISIVGFDEFDSAELLHPPLTTVIQPAYEFGARAINALIKIINNEKLGFRILELKPVLMIRESCKQI